MIDGFTQLHGDPKGDKNFVIQPVKWELTGRVNSKYAAPGASWPATGAKGYGKGDGKCKAKV